MPRSARGLLGIAIGCLAGLFLCEIGLRLTPARWLPNQLQLLERGYAGNIKWHEMVVGDSLLGFRYRPNLDVLFPAEGGDISIRTVDYGLGDVGFRDLGAQSPFDAVALGDSFTFCDEVSAAGCWVKQLARASGWSIANLGVSGYSTLAEQRILQRYGVQLRPRFVLLGIFANDFTDNLDFHDWLKSGTSDFWEWRDRRNQSGGVYRWLVDHVEVFRLSDGVWRSRDRDTYHYQGGDLDLVFQRWWMEPMDQGRRQQRAFGWDLMRRSLQEMRRTADGMGAQLIVVLLPSKEEVYFDIVRSALPNNRELAVDRPFDVVREFCRHEGIACCDTTAALQSRAAQHEQVYLRVSGHWNERGHAVAAASVHDCLVEKGLLSGHTESSGSVRPAPAAGADHSKADS